MRLRVHEFTVTLPDGRRLPGIEHARGNRGASVHVHVTDGGVVRPVWVRAGDVEPREDQT